MSLLGTGLISGTTSQDQAATEGGGFGRERALRHGICCAGWMAELLTSRYRLCEERFE
jgi:hypothetical protein